jgi:hypothetical protein
MDWGAGRSDWGAHIVIINSAPWRRTWVNRPGYIHPYEGVRRFSPTAPRPAEQQALYERSNRERQAAREGRRPAEGNREGRRSHLLFFANAGSGVLTFDIRYFAD